MANLSYLWIKRLAIGTVAITLPLVAMAFGPMGDGPGNCPPMPHPGSPMLLPMPGMFLDAPPPGIMPPFLHYLELSDAQQDKVFNLLHDQAPKARDSFKAAAKTMEELQRLSSSDNFDTNKARSLAEAHGAPSHR
jgi:periplasmic protein CpxP/Spy